MSDEGPLLELVCCEEESPLAADLTSMGVETKESESLKTFSTTEISVAVDDNPQKAIQSFTIRPDEIWLLPRLMVPATNGTCKIFNENNYAKLFLKRLTLCAHSTLI